MRKVLLAKAHVGAYTKQDGTYVAAHEDKRSSAKPDAPKAKKAKAVEPVAVPAGAKVTSASFEVKKVGNKWLTVTHPGKSYQMQLAISPETAHFQVGDKIENLPVGKVEEYSKYGSKVTFYPISAGDAEEAAQQKNKALLEQWIGYVENKAKEGWLYENGVDKLNQLGVKNHPELMERLQRAKAQISQIKAAKQEKAQKEASEKAAEHAKAVSKRVLYPLDNPPKLGQPVQRNGKWIVFESKGQAFKIGEDHPSIHGHHLLGYEGDPGAYFYYREAKPDEIPSEPKPVAADASAPSSKSESSGQWSDEEWAKHHIPEANKNYRTHKKQLDQMRAFAEAGDIQALKRMTFGINTYGKKRAETHRKLLEALGEKPLAKCLLIFAGGATLMSAASIILTPAYSAA